MLNRVVGTLRELSISVASWMLAPILLLKRLWSWLERNLVKRKLSLISLAITWITIRVLFWYYNLRLRWLKHFRKIDSHQDLLSLRQQLEERLRTLDREIRIIRRCTRSFLVVRLRLLGRTVRLVLRRDQ